MREREISFLFLNLAYLASALLYGFTPMLVEYCDQLFLETPPCHQHCYIWSCHGHCQAVPPDSWPGLQSASPCVYSCQVRRGFHNPGSTRYPFLLCEKENNLDCQGMWMRCCSRQRGPYGHGWASGSSAEMCMSSSKSSWCGNAKRLALFILKKAVHSNNKDKDFEYFLEFINYVDGVRTFGQVFLTFRYKLKCFQMYSLVIRHQER